MSGTTATFPIILTNTGLVPQTPAALQQALLANVAAEQPGYTANLPGTLIEDISSTDVAAMLVMDSAMVDTINSVTPYGVNEFLLTQLGNVYGTPRQSASNTSVYVVFQGAPGYVIQIGFVVSDGTYQYTVQDGGAILSTGYSPPLYCLATITGTWGVPENTVTQIVTSVPAGISLSCTNNATGTPGGAAETPTAWRVRTLQGGLAAAQGMPSFLRTLLGQISGVQQNLISVQTPATVQWNVICGGGDPYAVAFAIFRALFDVSTVVGSVIAVIGITQSNPGVVTTNLKHGYATGNVVTITGIVGMTALNGVALTVTVTSPYAFSVGVNTTGYGAWVSGGVCSPNNRNILVSINDYPNTYVIPFINPPQQAVTMTVTWNTLSTNYISPTSVASAANPALLSYVNGLNVGVPMNLFVLQQVFATAVAAIIPAQLLTRLVFTISIDGVSTVPESGTGIIAGDPQSYFYTETAEIIISQG